MKDDQLQTLVTQISRHFFQLEFKHKATFNKRLRTTGGRYLLEQHDIEINPRMAVLGNGVLIGIIKHELCHYHLHLQHLGYRHRDHAFKELLLQVGGLRYAPRTAAPVWKSQ
ncbi:MAG: SprT family protein, partial [Liquorilactobacillus satsumensis]